MFEVQKGIFALIKIIKDKERYHFANDWLSTYWHFSFDHYHDPNNMNWGPLRVFNDDIVQPSSGFPTHAHREMEIITYVLEGELEHKDSTGGIGRIRPGEVQRMSAGTGIRHSEYNSSTDTAVHLLQMWIIPAMNNLPPSYEQKQFSAEQRRGVLLPVASGRHQPETVKIHQDASIYVSDLGKSDQLTHSLADGRRAYLFVIKGELQLNDDFSLTGGDHARIEDEQELRFATSDSSQILLVDLP